MPTLGDASKGAAPGETFIHELVHQWWGLGNMFDTSDSASPWSAEGLTVYTTYRNRQGACTARPTPGSTMWTSGGRRWTTTIWNFYVRNPAYLERLPEAERLSISNSLSGVRQYSEMPLKILKAERLVGGEAAMDQDPP